MKWRIDKEVPRGSNQWEKVEDFDDGLASLQDDDWMSAQQARFDELQTGADCFQATYLGPSS